MSNEVLILGVKGSGKTVFLSVLGHRYEGVGEFGLSLSPDRQTWKFAYDYYQTMAPEDGSEQRFPAATDPKDNPLPLTWQVRVGTEPLFRMTTLECAGETMVEAFGGDGDAEAEERYSEEMTAAFDAIDASAATGVAAKADTVTKLRVMAKRASVICLFLNPRDFEGQVAALPGRYAERLERRLERLRASGAREAELSAARKASEKFLAKAREELKDRYGSMLDLLRTFLENPEYRSKRLVFVLTQAGGLERAIEEAGGAWGYLNANVRQLEAHDLQDRAEAIAVSAVNGVALVEEPDGEERERPDGPIEPTGLEDFLLTVGGVCSPKLESLKAARGKCLAAELRFMEAMREGEPAQKRLETARQWRNAAVEWMQATEHFVAGLDSVRAGVKQRTRAFAGTDVARADRRWYAESALWSRLAEDVASGHELPAGELEAWRAVANRAVEQRGMEAWTLDELGLEEGWLAEAIRKRQDEWRSLKRRFDEAITGLDWEKAQRRLESCGLDQTEGTYRRMAMQCAQARLERAETECRRALENGMEEVAEAKLREVSEAEADAGPSALRSTLERGLACLQARLEVRDRLKKLAGIRNSLNVGSSTERQAIAAAKKALPLAESALSDGETEYGKDNFGDLRGEYEKWTEWLAEKAASRSLRLRWGWGLAAGLAVLLAGAWGVLRWQAREQMESDRAAALEMAVDGNYAAALERLKGIRGNPLLGLQAADYAQPELRGKIEALENLEPHKTETLKVLSNLEVRVEALEKQHGKEKLEGLENWKEGKRKHDEGRKKLPKAATEPDEYGLMWPGDGAEERYGAALKLFNEAEKDYEKAAEEAAKAAAAGQAGVAAAKAVMASVDGAKAPAAAAPARANRAVDAARAMGVEDLDAAAKAAEMVTPEKLRSADPDKELKAVLDAGKATREPSVQEWRELVPTIDRIRAGADSTDEEKAAAAKLKEVCGAVAKCRAETIRRKRNTAIKDACDKGLWAKADELARQEPAASDKQLEEIKRGARESVHKALADAGRNPAAVMTVLGQAGVWRETLREEVAKAIIAYANLHYPEKSPKTFPATYQRDMEVLKKLSWGELQNSIKLKAKGWNRQWLGEAGSRAKEASARAGDSGRLAEAWNACEDAEAAVDAVKANPLATEGEKVQADEILANLPYLLRVQGRKRGASGTTYQPQPIAGIDIDGEGVCSAGVCPVGETADVAIVSVAMPCLKSGTAIPSVGSPKRFHHQFAKPGTQTVTVYFD